MQTNGWVKIAAFAAVGAFLASLAAFWSSSASHAGQNNTSDPIEELRAEVAALKESVASCRTTIEALQAERGKLTDQLAKLERDLARALDEARTTEGLVRDLVRQEVHAQQKQGKGGGEAGIQDWFLKMGFGKETVGKIRTHFGENEFSDKQIEQALVGVLKRLHQIREEGDGREMDPRLRDHLQGEVGLTDKQIELVDGVARRLAQHQRDGKGKDKQPMRPPGERELF